MTESTLPVRMGFLTTPLWKPTVPPRTYVPGYDLTAFRNCPICIHSLYYNGTRNNGPFFACKYKCFRCKMYSEHVISRDYLSSLPMHLSSRSFVRVLWRKIPYEQRNLISGFLNYFTFDKLVLIKSMPPFALADWIQDRADDESDVGRRAFLEEEVQYIRCTYLKNFTA